MTQSSPGRVIPDLIVELGNSYAVCEFKASRTTDPRFDSVLDSGSSIARHLAERKCTTRGVTEVEQDIIKLLAYRQACPTIGSAIFLMIDGYGANNSGRSWSWAFSDQARWLGVMKTSITEQALARVFGGLSIQPIACGRMRANMISLAV